MRKRRTPSLGVLLVAALAYAAFVYLVLGIGADEPLRCEPWQEAVTMEDGSQWCQDKELP